MSSRSDLPHGKYNENIIVLPLSEITNMSAGDRVTKAKMSNEQPYPVMGAGIVPTGYYNDWNRENCITISRAGAGAGTIGWHPEKFWATDVCFLAEEKEGGPNIKYIFYAMKAQENELRKHIYGGSMPKIDKAYLWKMPIPIPPVEIQEKIVKTLDMFSMLSPKLNQEIEMRKMQFAYYQNKLLNFEKDVPVLKLSECCNLEKGQTAIQKSVPGQYPMVVTTSVRKTSNTFQFDRPTVCIPLVSSRGHGVACLNQVFYQEGKFALGNILCGVTPLDESFLSAEYIYYYLNYKKDTLIVPLMKGGANVSLTVNSLKNVKIPVPSFESQVQIVRKLKPFDKICDVLKQEIDDRKIQYEFYRNRMLSFVTVS